MHFARGIPPEEAIPADLIAKVTTAVLDAERKRVFQYVPIGTFTGDPSLREELGSFHGRDPDHVFVTNGSLQALDLLTAHLMPACGASVLVEAPTYDRAAQIFRRHGARLVGVPLLADGPDIDRLERELEREVPAFLYCIPDFQNPSGVTTSQAKRRELVRLSARHGFPIVEDVPYRELRCRGEAPDSLARLAGEARVVTIGSLSKVLSPGLRVGYVIADRDTVTALARRAESTYLSPSPLCQAIAAGCMSEGIVRGNIERVRALLAPRLDAAVAAVRAELGDVLLAEPEGGYYVSVALPVAVAEDEFLAAARASGLVLTQGSAFYPDGTAPPAGTVFLRLPFQSVAPTEFAEGVHTLAELAERPTSN